VTNEGGFDEATGRSIELLIVEIVKNTILELLPECGYNCGYKGVLL
jgi:hypothetical protein